MQYSQEFLGKLYEIYPDDAELQRLADNADPKLWGILHDRARPLFELCGMANKEKPVTAALSAQSRFA